MSPAEGDCDMRRIQAGELGIASAAPRWLPGVVCCLFPLWMGPAFLMCLEASLLIAAGREVGIVLVVALGLFFSNS